MPRALTKKQIDKSERIALEYLNGRPTDKPYAKSKTVISHMCVHAGMKSSKAHDTLNDMQTKNMIVFWRIKIAPRNTIATRKKHLAIQATRHVKFYLAELKDNDKSSPIYRTLDAIIREVNPMLDRNLTRVSLRQIVTESQQLEIQEIPRPTKHPEQCVTLIDDSQDDKVQTQNRTVEKIQAPGFTGRVIALAETPTPSWAEKIDE